MPLSKLNINIIFVFLVIALGATAITSAIMLSKHTTAPESSLGHLPKNHPPIDFSKELAELEQLSAKDPKNADYRTRIGNIFYDMGRYEKAVDYYNQSLDLKPRDPKVETDLAVCFHYLGQQDMSLKTLDRVLEYKPDFPEAMFNKGIVLITGKKDIMGGIAVWEKLLQLHPDYPRRAELQQSIDQLKASLK